MRERGETNRGKSKRKSAIGYLGRLGHVHAIPALLAVIRDEENHDGSRGEAIIALSRIRDKRVVDHLIDMLDDDIGETANIQLFKITGVAIGVISKPIGIVVSKEFDTLADRLKIQDEWRAWWNRNRERAYLRSRTHAARTFSHLPPLFMSEDMWSPSLIRPHPELKFPGENQ
jgi:hypothetical protein